MKWNASTAELSPQISIKFRDKFCLHSYSKVFHLPSACFSLSACKVALSCAAALEKRCQACSRVTAWQLSWRLQLSSNDFFRIFLLDGNSEEMLLKLVQLQLILNRIFRKLSASASDNNQLLNSNTRPELPLNPRTHNRIEWEISFNKLLIKAFNSFSRSRSPSFLLAFVQ